MLVCIILKIGDTVRFNNRYLTGCRFVVRSIRGAVGRRSGNGRSTRSKGRNDAACADGSHAFVARRPYHGSVRNVCGRYRRRKCALFSFRDQGERRIIKRYSADRNGAYRNGTGRRHIVRSKIGAVGRGSGNDRRACPNGRNNAVCVHRSNAFVARRPNDILIGSACGRDGRGKLRRFFARRQTERGFVKRHARNGSRLIDINVCIFPNVIGICKQITPYGSSQFLADGYLNTI